MSLKITTLAAAALALAALTQPASAGGGFVQSSVTVSYADLNLSSPEGAKALYKRIKQAATTACGPKPAGIVLQRFASAQWEYKSCIRGAVDNAVASLNNPLVSAYHNGGKRALVAAAADYSM
jgi:UrcA family protein